MSAAKPHSPRTLSSASIVESTVTRRFFTRARGAWVSGAATEGEAAGAGWGDSARARGTSSSATAAHRSRWNVFMRPGCASMGRRPIAPSADSGVDTPLRGAGPHLELPFALDADTAQATAGRAAGHPVGLTGPTLLEPSQLTRRRSWRLAAVRRRGRRRQRASHPTAFELDALGAIGAGHPLRIDADDPGVRGRPRRQVSSLLGTSALELRRTAPPGSHVPLAQVALREGAALRALGVGAAEPVVRARAQLHGRLGRARWRWQGRWRGLRGARLRSRIRPSRRWRGGTRLRSRCLLGGRAPAEHGHRGDDPLPGVHSERIASTGSSLAARAAG